MRQKMRGKVQKSKLCFLIHLGGLFAFEARVSKPSPLRLDFLGASEGVLSELRRSRCSSSKFMLPLLGFSMDEDRSSPLPGSSGPVPPSPLSLLLGFREDTSLFRKLRLLDFCSEDVIVRFCHNSEGINDRLCCVTFWRQRSGASSSSLSFPLRVLRSVSCDG